MFKNIFLSLVSAGQVCEDPSCVIPNSLCHRNVIIPLADGEIGKLFTKKLGTLTKDPPKKIDWQ